MYVQVKMYLIDIENKWYLLVIQWNILLKSVNRKNV